MGKGTSLPAGYILQKGKKHYGSGRPIIGFFKAPFKPMLTTLAKLLFQLVPRACPDHFAKGDVYQLLHLLRNYAIAMGTKDLRLFNQDLSGFFISIDSDRFLQSWYMLTSILGTNYERSGTWILFCLACETKQPWRHREGTAFPHPQREQTYQDWRCTGIDYCSTWDAELPAWIEGLHPSTRIPDGVTPFAQPCAWWWSPSMNKFGFIHTVNLFPIYTSMHYFWDTWTIDWLFFRHLPRIFLHFRFLSIQIFTRLQIFWKQSLIRSFWAFKLNLTLSNCAISHLRTCPQVLSPMSASPSCCSSQWICVTVFHCSQGIFSQIASGSRYPFFEETLCESWLHRSRPEQDREARFETKEVKNSPCGADS